MYRYRVFTLEEANRVLPMIEEVTEHTRDRLQTLKLEEGEELEGSELQQRAREILNAWARIVLDLGAQPKGIFTVDFRSPDPNVLWCWAPGEREISHRHFVWESFKDRLPIQRVAGIWPSQN